MARDIEDFLRRAAERRQQQMKQKQGGAPPPVQRPAPPPPQQRQAPKPKPKPRPVVVVRDDVEVVDMRKQSVREHVQTHIDTSSIAYHAEHLTDDISQTDERLEDRLHDKFDHEVSKLEDKISIRTDTAPSATKDDVSGIAMDIVKMIKTPSTMRQAILMAEVLKRPDFED